MDEQNTSSAPSQTIPCPPPIEDDDIELLLDQTHWTVVPLRDLTIS